MGCCLGTTTKTPNPPPPDHHPNGPNNRHFQARSSVPEPYPTQVPKTQLNGPIPPPPPPVVEVEEESVKEVLSETPISNTGIPKTPQEKNPKSPPKTQSEPPEEEEEVAAKEPSQASASCGVSESYSYSTTTTTTTIADARDDDEATSKRRRELGRRVNGSLTTTAVRRKHPYSGDLVGRRERGPRPQPRASEQPIAKRNRTETRSFRGRESGQLRNTQRVGAPTGVRRDTASSRSRSPATRNAGGVGRGALGRSPAKVTGRAGSSSSQLGAESEANNNKKDEEEANDGVSKQGNESIDNPLVSLECFIFV